MLPRRSFPPTPPIASSDGADPVADAPVAEEPAAEPVAEDAPAPDMAGPTPEEATEQQADDDITYREDDLIDRARIVVLVTHQLPPDTRADLVIDLGVSPPEKSRKNPLRSSISGRTLTSTRERRWSEVDEL